MEKTKKIEFLKNLYKTRFFENKAKEVFIKGLIFGSLHLGIGQEAISVGACGALEKDDYILSSHRGNGQFIVKGTDIKFMMAEFMGKETGLCKGRGGHIHIFDRKLGMLGPNGVIGGGMPIAVGAAISAVYRKSNQVVACFFGDGGANIGEFHESLNLAGLWKLPVIFICENNQIAATTLCKEVLPVKNISDRACAYGIYGNFVNGNDVEDVYNEVKKRVDAARNGEGASLIECKTLRRGPHCVSMSDTLKGSGVLDDSKSKSSDWAEDDPVLRYEKKLLEEKVIDKERIAKLKEEINSLIEEAVEFGEKSNFPNPETVKDFVYSD